jgi:hypothetical protein
MHYVPAVSERVAFGVSVGASVAGIKSVVMVDSSYLFANLDWFDFCKNIGHHILVMTNKEMKNVAPIIVVDPDFETLRTFISNTALKNQVGILVLNEVK